MLVILVVFCAATARLIIWPAQGMPAHVDAIVVLGGYGNRLDTGIDLWHQGRVPRPGRFAPRGETGSGQSVFRARPNRQGHLF